VASGANGAFNNDDFDKAMPELLKTEYVLMQLEIPIPTVEYIAEKSVLNGKKVILNPAPAVKISDNLLKNLYIITPNETEAEILTGIRVSDEQTALTAAKYLNKQGVEIVIITMGSKGAYLYHNGKGELIPAAKVKAVDSTAAGDTFNGALAVALTEGKSLHDSIVFANKAASISVTRLGAQSSIPFREELMN
jgi:ribokinase